MDGEINRNIIYSILDKQPKRANVYWFVNVQVTDEPFTQEYSVDMLGTDFIVQVQLYLGFHISQVNVYLRQIVHDLMKTGRLPKQPQRYSLTPGREVGDFQFVLIQEELSNVSELKNGIDKLCGKISYQKLNYLLKVGLAWNTVKSNMNPFL